MDDRTTPGPTADDEAIARLRAADPAADAEPDATTLRGTVDARIGAQAPGVDELAARRSRRWTSWPARLAGVAAATLVVGMGGGYALGSAGGGDTIAAQPPITLNAPAPAGAGGAESGMTDGATAEDARGGGMADSIWPGYYGRTVFTASGLSEEGGVAQAWAFDPSTVYSAETVAALAAALGVSGSPVQDDWAWSVGPNDGSGPYLQLSADGMANVNYYDPTKDVWRCDTSILPEPELMEEQADPSAGSDVAPSDPCRQQDLGAAPKDDAAIAVLRDVLAAIGVDAAEVEFAAEDYGDAAWTYVMAYQVVDGQQTGMAWSASLTGAGLQSLNGFLAPLVTLGEYGVVSPAEAVRRLSDPRFGSTGGGYYPMGPEDGGGVLRDTPVVPSVPEPVTPGAEIRWPVSQVTITQARLGLAMHHQPGGAVLLVPSYELTSSDGGIWSVIAVADSQLDFAAER